MNSHLTLGRLEPASLGYGKKAARFEVQPEAVAGDRTNLSIGITADQSGAALPDGLLGYLIFDVAEDAPPSVSFLEVEKLVVRSTSQEMLQGSSAGPTKMTILSQKDLDAAIAACFFYMH